MSFQAIAKANVSESSDCGHKHKTEAAASACGDKEFGLGNYTIKARAARPKYVSRANRLGQAEGQYASASETCQQIAQTIRETLDEGEESYDGTLDEVTAIANLESIDTELGNANGEVESLREEIDSWKSGMEGTNLENSEKYSMLEECYSALEDVLSEGEEAGNELSITLPEELTYAALSTFAETLDDISEKLENAVNACGSVEFPGMY